MSGAAGNLALEGGDPRIYHSITPRNPKPYDSSIKLEEYMYFADLERKEEAQRLATAQRDEERHTGGFIYRLFKRQQPVPESRQSSQSETSTTGKAEESLHAADAVEALPPTHSSAVTSVGENKKPGHRFGFRDDSLASGYIPQSDEEARVLAARALRTAKWTSVWFLIVTDVLGPYSAPYAFSTMGWVPSILMYFVFAVVSAYTGTQIWRMYLYLDSAKYPCRTFSDLAFRIFGPWARHLTFILQALQLFLNVAVLILQNGQSLSQIAQGNACFSVLMMAFTLAGLILGQIRTLRNFSWLANIAVWLNLITLFITMGVVAHVLPNYDAAEQQNGITGTQIVITAAFGDNPLTTQIVGVMQLVYSYGGALLFCEMMSEMRNPREFIKSMLCAESFIFIVYVIFGSVVYHFQGQFTVNPAYQGISAYGWQTAMNITSLIAALIACVLYANIGIKVLYNYFVAGIMRGPGLTERKGKINWVILVPIYWAIAFVVGSAIPQLNNISGLVAALAIVSFFSTITIFAK